MENLDSFESLVEPFLGDHLTLSKADLESTLEKTALAMIYYSSAIEGNKTPQNTAELLFNADLFDGKATLPDYLELLNHMRVYERSIAASKTKITKQNILDIHSQLMDGIIGIHPNIKRFRVNFGPYVTPPPNMADSALENAAATINMQEPNKIAAFLKAIGMHLDLFYAHPFEDGNKRTCRLLTNLYLLKNFMKPLMVTLADKETYFEALMVYDFTKYNLPFIAEIAKIYLRDEASDIVRKIKNTPINRPEELEFRQLLLSAFSENGEGKRVDVCNKLASDPKTVRGGLWLLARYGIDDEHLLIEEAKSHIAEVRAMALWGMWKINTPKYYDILKEHALADTEPSNRILAFTALSSDEKRFQTDIDLIRKIVQKETDEAVLARVCQAMAYHKDRHAASEIIREIIEKQKSPTIAVRGYSAIANFEDENTLLDLLKGLERGPAFDFVISRLFQNSSMNKPKVAKELTDLAADEPSVRKIILYNLAQKPQALSPEYMKLLDRIIKEESTTAIEKAYAIYTLGVAQGYAYILSNYGLSIEKPKHNIEDAAVFMTYKSSFKDKMNPNVLFKTQNSDTVIVEALELNKILKDGKFGSHFLELYRKGLAR